MKSEITSQVVRANTAPGNRPRVAGSSGATALPLVSAFSLAMVLFAGCEQPVPGPWSGDMPEGIILLIGDGMGAEHLRAASLYENGTDDGLTIQQLSVPTDVDTGSASVAVTDSAAAATAMATGEAVYNGVISTDRPGTGDDLRTILEMAHDTGMSVGLVTTTYLTHATPAAFGAHAASRGDHEEIASDYLTGSRPDVLMGGGGNGLIVSAAQDAGYTVLTTRDELLAFDTVAPLAAPLAVLIGEGHLPYVYDVRPDDVPSLVEMTATAVDLLAQDPDGFFLMVEAGRIDHASHSNDLARMVPEVLELGDMVGTLVQDTALMATTAVIVTADHETGGLSVESGNGIGQLPTVSWRSGGHTRVDVPLYAAGVGAEAFAAVTYNEDVYFVMKDLLGVR